MNHFDLNQCMVFVVHVCTGTLYIYADKQITGKDRKDEKKSMYWFRG